MPSKSPSEALEALVTQSYPIPAAVWGDFWDRLAAGELAPGEALAVVSSLTSRLPDGSSVSALLSSLRERNPVVPEAFAELVHKMLAKSPDLRFASASEVESALAPWRKSRVYGLGLATLQ